jgi:Fic family protein
MLESLPEKKYPNPHLVELAMSSDFSALRSKIEKDYPYWDKAKYLFPDKSDKEQYWNALRFRRFLSSAHIQFAAYTFSFPRGDYFLKELHDFDMDFGGSLVSNGLISQKNKIQYQISSIMEEAIASSQMEGANTTRKVAKEMLRRQAKPKDKSQQMIVNNYNTIRFLVEHKDEPLSVQLLLQIHQYISEKTLDNQADEGAFRTSNDIVVQDSLSGEIAHVPPKSEELPDLVKALAGFANNDDPDLFIHPIIKAIIIHFMISYFHPFADGNGRTARSLFYWYMLKKGYWLTEFLSISRIICKSKKQYENAFLYTEKDGLDLGYFIQYNLDVMNKAYDELRKYLERKLSEQSDVVMFSSVAGINGRQAQMLRIATEKPETVFISRELESLFAVSVKTIRSDLQELVSLGFLTEVALNKRLVGYIRTENFEPLLKKYQNNKRN